MDKGIPGGAFDGVIDAIAERVAEKTFQKLRETSSNDPDGPRWLTMKQAAARVGIDYSAIVKATNSGELLYYTPLGRKRIDPAELDEWVRDTKYHSSTTSPAQSEPKRAISRRESLRIQPTEFYRANPEQPPPRS